MTNNRCNSLVVEDSGINNDCKDIETEEVLTKRICESTEHEEIELEPFEECPICNSTCYHRVLKFISGRWV